MTTSELPALVPFRHLVRVALGLASAPVVEGSRRNADGAVEALRAAREEGLPSPELMADLAASAAGRRRSA